MSPPHEVSRPGGNATRTAQKSNAKDYCQITATAVCSNVLSLPTATGRMATVRDYQAKIDVLGILLTRVVLGSRARFGTNCQLRQHDLGWDTAERRVD